MAVVMVVMVDTVVMVVDTVVMVADTVVMVDTVDTEAMADTTTTATDILISVYRSPPCTAATVIRRTIPQQTIPQHTIPVRTLVALALL